MAEKEVATKKGKTKAREESFGSAPPDVSLAKGADMATFGYRTTDTLWPKATDPVSTKTGYPEGHEK